MRRWITTLCSGVLLSADRLRVPRRWFRAQRKGSALVEFAMGSGVLLAAFAGTFELGYTLNQYNRLLTAVAQGARYASLIPYDSPTDTPSAAFQTAVQNVVLYGAPAVGATAVLSDITASNVRLTVTFSNGVPSSVTVSITGYTVNALFGNHLLSGKPQVTYPYQGVWAPV